MGSSPLDRAEGAVLARIEELAGKEGTTVDQAKTLAEGVGAIKHGPQGGHLKTDYHYSSQVDYHYTAHQGENRDRPPAGFGSDAS